MPGIPHAHPEQFVQSAAVLHVPDVLAAAAFYRDVLGFTFDFGDAYYAVVWRENAALHFSKGQRAPQDIHLFFWIRNVDAYYEEIRGRDLDIETEPTTQPYGIREFSLVDCNNVRLVFGQDDELI